MSGRSQQDDTRLDHELSTARAPASGEGGFDAVPPSDRGDKSAPSPFDLHVETQGIPVDGPQRLGRYRLAGLLGKGGMAEVYLAQQDGPAGFQKTCVVKRIRRSLAEEPKFIEMFLREARIAARLNHPNVVQIFELGQDGKDYFIAMEFLDGVSLHRAARRSWTKDESVPMEVALRAVADAALGLHHAHTLMAPGGRPTPLVHRDVSPDNIMLTRDGVSKLLDFGIAKSTDVEEQTSTGEVKGKIPFMSPEQLQGHPLDGRSDLWSLGVTLYWLLTGKRPFDGPTEPMTIDAIMRREPARPRELNPLVPGSVDKIVMKLLEKDREKRIATAAELSDRLLSLLGPSAGYSGSAQFASKVMEWKDADGAPPPSALTIIAARPASQWLKRIDGEPSSDFDLVRLAPETTPPGAMQRTGMDRMTTEKTVTGVNTDALLKSAKPRLWPIAAGLFAAVVVGAGALAAVNMAKEEDPAVAPIVIAAAEKDPEPVKVEEPAPKEAPAKAEPEPAAASPIEPLDDPPDERQRRSATSSSGTLLVKTSAPPKVVWKLNGRVVGRGAGSLKVSKSTTKLLAVDPDTGGQTTVSVIDGRADYDSIGEGTLDIRVRPWAEVHLGAKKLGTTPLDPLQLKAGRYEVAFTREGTTKRKTVEVRPGATARMNVEMRE